MLCPIPIIRLARTAGSLPQGSLVELLTDDPAAEYDVPAWCQLRGHVLVLTEPLGSQVPVPPPADPPSPEPHSPNLSPGQAVRHLIRLGGAAGSA